MRSKDLKLRSLIRQMKAAKEASSRLGASVINPTPALAPSLLTVFLSHNASSDKHGRSSSKSKLTLLFSFAVRSWFQVFAAHLVDYFASEEVRRNF